MTFRTSGIHVLSLLLLLVPVRALAGDVLPALPTDVTFNKDAGRGDLMIVPVSVEDGQELSFILDTGCPTTLLDKSLEPKLGQALATNRVWLLDDAKDRDLTVYPAPRLFMGGAQLISGEQATVLDFEKLSRELGRKVSGILGMDCLEHYCVQMDFAARKLHFLDATQLDTSALGEAYPLMFTNDHVFIARGSLVGEHERLLQIDTGANSDGSLKSKLFSEEVWKQKGPFQWLVLSILSSQGWTAQFSKSVWDGRTYTGLRIQKIPQWYPNFAGLHFLARHLVTFDFPRRVMYLKQISTGSLPPDISTAYVNEEFRTPLVLLLDLKNKGQLPGWSADDTGEAVLETHIDFGAGRGNVLKGAERLERPDDYAAKSVIIVFQKKNDAVVYHYQIERSSNDSPWALKKAWWRDGGGKLVEAGQ